MTKNKKQAYVKWLVISVFVGIFSFHAVVKAVDDYHPTSVTEKISLSLNQELITEKEPFIITLEDKNLQDERIQIELPQGLIYESKQTKNLENDGVEITQDGQSLFINFKKKEEKEIQIVISATQVGEYHLFASTIQNERTIQSKSLDLLVQPKKEKEQPMTEKKLNEGKVVQQPREQSMQVEPTSVSVSNWDEFLAAINNDNVSIINIAANITKTSGDPATISRNVTINGNGYFIDFGTSYLELSNGGEQFTLNDMTFTKTKTTALVYATGVWNIVFHNVSTGPNNEGEAVYARDGTLHLKGENYLKSSGNTITVLHFITSDGAKSLISTDQSAGLQLEKWALGINDGYRHGGTIMVDQAELTVHSENTPAIRLRWGGNLFQVKNHANVHVVTDSSNSKRATINFSGNFGKNNTFEVLNESVVNIEHLDGTASSLRINGDNLHVNVEGGSKLQVYNKGNKTPSDNSNIALELEGHGKFVVSDPNSQLNLIADYGPAVWGDEKDTILHVGQDTEFIARGQTKSEDVGIFNMAKKAEISIDNPLLYDFANTRVGGGNIFSISGRDGFFKATNSDVSVWAKGTDIYNDEPVKNWSLISFSLTGKNLATIQTSEYHDELNSETFGEPNLYSRMSGNNARPIVDELQVPTDADMFIYGHVTIPEGVENMRDAWKDEATVEIIIKNKDGSESYRSVGVNIGAKTINVNGQTLRKGIFKIPVPNGEFLKAHQTIEVEKAYRGGADSTCSRVHQTLPEDIRVPIRTVMDITPPNPATEISDYDKIANQNEITNATKRISGKSDEPGSIVQLGINGEVIEQETTVQADGTWIFQLPYYLQKGDKVQIFLSDKAGAKTELSDRPLTNQERGNINPTSTFTYRDATFEPGPIVIVKDVLPTENTLVKSVSVNNEEHITKAGSVLTYSIHVKNDKDSLVDTVWNDVIVKDTIASGVDLDVHSIKVNGEQIDKTHFTFHPDSRLLEIPIGDLQSQQEATVTFKAMVTSLLIGQTIKNKAQAIGKTLREETFMVGEPNPFAKKETIIQDSNIVKNPGGLIVEGTLELFSVPSFVSFGKNLKISSKDQTYPLSQLEGSLAVRDTRKYKNEWTLKAQIIEPLQTETKQTMEALLIYSTNNEETVINEEPVIVYQSVSKNDYPVIISRSWLKGKDGLFLRVKAGEAYKGNMNGKMRWILEDAP